jgi:hypothetical protein
MQHQTTDNRSSPTTAFKPTRPARRSHARKHLAPNKCMALVPAARRSPVIIEASHAAGCPSLPLALVDVVAAAQPAGENPEHLLWPPGSPSARPIKIRLGSSPSLLVPVAARGETELRATDRHGKNSVLRQQWDQEGTVGAGGGQAARRLRPGQRCRKLAHAPQARGYVRTCSVPRSSPARPPGAACVT